MLPATQGNGRTALLWTVIPGLYSSVLVGLSLGVLAFSCVGVVFMGTYLLSLAFIGQILHLFLGELQFIDEGMGVVLFWVLVPAFLRVVALGGMVLVGPFISHWGDIPSIVMIWGNGVVPFMLVVVLLGLLLLGFDLTQLQLQFANLSVSLLQLFPICLNGIFLDRPIILNSSLSHLMLSSHLFIHFFLFFGPHPFDLFVVIGLGVRIKYTQCLHALPITLLSLQHLHLLVALGFSLLLGSPVEFFLGLDAVLDCLADEGVGGCPLDIVDVQTAEVVLVLGRRGRLWVF